MEEQQDMLSKENDSYENNEKQVDEEKVVIKYHPKKDLVPTYYCDIFLIFIVTIAMTCKLGLCGFVLGTLITLLSIIKGTSVFFSIIFDKNQITTLFKKNERIFYWNELKTIRLKDIIVHFQCMMLYISLRKMFISSPYLNRTFPSFGI